MNNENEEASKYAQAMEMMNTIKLCDTVEKLNQAFDTIKTMEHHLTSKEELWFALTEQAKAIGCSFDKVNKVFVYEQ